MHVLLTTEMKKQEESKKRKGGNCDVVIDREHGLAKKTLRNTSKGKPDRFRTEIRIAESLRSRDDLNIAKVIETHEESDIKKCYILMRFYEYNLADLLDNTRGNVRYTFQLLLPIIKTLNTLSSLEEPIYHRDLKPENILSDGDSLFLSDFGIAFVDDGGDRQTTTMEAVGARLFLAPEYEVGRVESINEKGDIYFLGKIIWFLINGRKDELLPYNLWFEDAFNLSKRFPNVQGIHFANFIIMNCLEIKPDKRMSYSAMINDIEAFLNDKLNFSNVEEELRVSVRKKENEQAKAYNTNLEFLLLVSEEFEVLFERLRSSFSESAPILQLTRELSIKGRVDYAANRGPTGSITTSSYGDFFIRVNFLGDHFGNNYIEIDYLKKPQHSVKKIKIESRNGNLIINGRTFSQSGFYQEFLTGLKLVMG